LQTSRISHVLRRISLPALCAGNLAAIAATPASAAFPGQIGAIAFEQLNSLAGGTVIGTVEPDGSGLRTITAPRAGARQPSFSADGRWIAYVASPGAIFRMGPDGRRRHRLTPNRGLEESPSWSPNGSRLAYVHTSGVGAREIFTARLNGRGKHRVTTVSGIGALGDLHPGWSPDGRWIAFARDAEAIWLAQPNGGDARQLVEVQGVGGLSWQAR